jgi:hypothetical protein
MQLPYYIINMNMPDFEVPATLSNRPPTQQEQARYRTAMDAYGKLSDEDKKTAEKPVAPKTTTVSNAAVCHDIIKTALQMAVSEGNPDTLRRLTKLNELIEHGLNNGGQLILSPVDYKFVQSKFAKADKWNTNPDVCKTVVEVQDTISRAAFVTTSTK